MNYPELFLKFGVEEFMNPRTFYLLTTHKSIIAQIAYGVTISNTLNLPMYIK